MAERLEVWKSPDGKHHYHRVAGNGEVTDPSQGYASRSHAVRAAREDEPSLPIHVLVEGKTERILPPGDLTFDTEEPDREGLPGEWID